jgi:hypothetical protein
VYIVHDHLPQFARPRHGAKDTFRRLQRFIKVGAEWKIKSGWQRRRVELEPLDEIDVFTICLDVVNFAEFEKLVAFQGV